MMRFSKVLTIKSLLILGILGTVYAQKSQVVDSEEYQLLKANGQLKQAEQVSKQKNYPELINAISLMEDDENEQKTLETTDVSRLSVLQTAQTFSCTIEDPRYDPSFLTFPRNDDGSVMNIQLPFTFNFFGSYYTQLYLNNNGNITFDDSCSTYTSTGFPTTYDMIAPFWADVDTRDLGSGIVYYKIEATRFTAIWYKVGYYNEKSDKLNTFKLVITDGTDATLGVGNNVAFYYGDMQWATGDASGGTDGFYGVPATVGVNNGQSNGSCFYYQIGRFGNPGSEYINHYDASGIDYLDNKCFVFDASVIDDVTIDFNWKNLLCAIDFDIQIDNPQNCWVVYQWDFGDGNTSLESNPLHSYGSAGTYTVNLNVYYQCGACQLNSQVITKQVIIDPDENLFKDTLISVTSELKSNVISSAVSTFSDTWPLQYEALDLSDKSGYLNGSQGVWRSESSYVYDVNRQQTTAPVLSTDGTFELEQFNWEQSSLEAVPDWIRVNTSTIYSPYGYELENRNALDIYSAALYDYGGHLPSATGVNMQNTEMAYTSFEYLTGKASGNWIFGSQSLPRYRWFDTYYNHKHIVVVKASLQELEGYNKVDVYGRNYFFGLFGFLRYRHIRDNEIVCRQEYPLNPEWSILILRRALFEGTWKGYVMVRNEVLPVISPDIDNSVSHSGSTSLKVTTEKTFTQTLLLLDSAKSYQINAWVSVNDMHQTIPVLAENLGINVTLKDQNDNEVASFSFNPSGPIVEGWQQVKGEFISPVKNPVIELTFKPGSTGTAWYDDLRLFPSKGNMKSYVYNLTDYRLQAILDEENFASFFYYDEEGNLYLTKKETKDGIKTLSENVGYIIER